MTAFRVHWRAIAGPGKQVSGVVKIDAETPDDAAAEIRAQIKAVMPEATPFIDKVKVARS